MVLGCFADRPEIQHRGARGPAGARAAGDSRAHAKGGGLSRCSRFRESWSPPLGRRDCPGPEQVPPDPRLRR